MSKVEIGLDILSDGHWKKLKGKRLGLLSNQASIDRDLRPAKEVLSKCFPGDLKALFGPQHGHGGEDQDNMVETDHSRDNETGIPVFSLYSKTRHPLPEMLDPIDILIIDLQDVGTRVYTFASTMLLCLKAAVSMKKKVLILDRPNPLGGDVVEGNLLKEALYSFVGPYKLPMRHGLTMGEMAGIFNHALKIGADLDVIPMTGWERRMLWRDTGLRWVMPSPNMPFSETAQVYPGQVIWEGTNISEGRGTCRPFEVFGAPFLDTKLMRERLSPESLSGCVLQHFSFRPTFHKWAQKLCRGFLIHITDPLSYYPYWTSLALLASVIETHGDRLEWKERPYEYEFKKKPIDLILGDSSIRKELEAGGDLGSIRDGWIEDLKDYMEWRRPFLLYD